MSKRRTKPDCSRLITMCLYFDSNDIVEALQRRVKAETDQSVYSKEQAINRIIVEWSVMNKLHQEP